MNGLPELQQVVAGEPGFVFVIHVDKMPPGSVLWIAAFQNGDRVEAPGISVQYLNSIPQHCR